MPVDPVSVHNLDLPGAIWLLKACLVAGFVLHVIAMLVTLGGLLISAYDVWGDGKIARRLAPDLLPWVAATITLGVVPLLFHQVLYGPAYYPTTIIMGWLWMMVILCLACGYFGLYFYSLWRTRYPAAERPLLTGVAILFLSITVLFVAQTTISLYPDTWQDLHESSRFGLYLPLGKAHFWARLVFVLSSAIALGSLLMAWNAAGKVDIGARGRIAVGIRTYSRATLLTFLLGIAVAATAPQASQDALLKTNYGALVAMGLGVLIMGWSLYNLRGAELVKSPRQKVAGTALGILSVLCVLGYVRHAMRAAVLDDVVQLSGPAVRHAQISWWPPILFGVVLLGGIVIIIWLVKPFWTFSFSKGEEGEGLSAEETLFLTPK